MNPNVAETEMTATVDQKCSILRTKLKPIAVALMSLKNAVANPGSQFSGDKGEMIANLMLAYRHLEDASMRLGKTIQAYEGGTSIYDQNDARRAAGLQAENKK